jgi:GT2 family glycosyltransferase
MSIPCVGFLTFNRPDLSIRLLNSFDAEIDHLVIINNGPYSHETWKEGAKDKAKKVSVHTQYNTGVACGWNMIIKDAPGAAYWMILNDDLILAPGDMVKLGKEALESGEDVAICAPNPIGLAMMAVKPVAINEVGLFDENFYPAYLEDCDYMWRTRVANLKFRYFYGCDSVHEWSMANKSDRRVAEFNSKVRTQATLPYYIAKWGGDGGEEKYSIPFNGEKNNQFLPFMRARILDIAKEVGL